MNINTQSQQTVNASLANRQQQTVPKENAVKKDIEKNHPTQDVQTEVTKQTTEIPEKTTASLELPRENIQEAVNKLQDYVDKYNRDLRFAIDDDTGRTVVSLLDKDNNVVKQYPSEEILGLIKNLEQNKGLFIGEA